MSGSAAKIAIRITAKDQTSGPLDAINKRLAALAAPAEKFNKALAKFGDTSGLSRVTEGVRGLGAGAADAFRSLDRMASPLAAITSVGSLAGIAALTRKWAEFGNQIGQTAYRLNMPVEKLGALRGAMRLAGGSAADADAGMRGLQDTLNGAAFGRDPHAIQLFRTLGVSFGDAEHGARNASDALGDIADKIKDMPAATQARVLNETGLGEGMLPLLKNGRKGLEDFQKQAEQTGGVMTGQMVKNATEMNTAWQRLGLDFEGVGNRIVDSWSGTVTKILENSSHWIENNKKLADNIATVAAGIVGLGAIKPAMWILRLLGLATAAEAAATTAVLASPLLLSGDTPSDPLLNQPATGGPGFFGQGGTLERWIRHPFGGGSSTPGPIVAPHGPSAAAATMQHAHDYFRGKGLTEEQTAGVLSNIGAESNFNPTASGDNGTSYGLFQHHAERLTKMQKWAGTATPSEQQQLDFAWSELNGPEHDTLDKLQASKTPWKSGAVFSGFERPANAAGEAIRRGEGADQFVQNPSQQGHVQVDVHLKGAPAGTTAKVTSSGPVTAPPPRIETPMPMVN